MGDIQQNERNRKLKMAKQNTETQTTNKRCHEYGEPYVANQGGPTDTPPYT